MITFLLTTIIALVFYITIKHYANSYGFLEKFVVPTGIIFWVLLALFVVVVVVKFIKMIKNK